MYDYELNKKKIDFACSKYNKIKIMTMCEANTKKGNKCPLSAKYFVGEYVQKPNRSGKHLCGNHFHYKDREQCTFNLIEIPKKEKKKKENQFDSIDYEHHIDCLYNSSTRDKNDCSNKERELMIHLLINKDNKLFIHYENVRIEYRKLQQKKRNLQLESKESLDFYKKIKSKYINFKAVKLNLKRELVRICKEEGIKYSENIGFKSKLKAGQGNHHDITLTIYNKKDNKDLCKLKLEYKYGQDSVSKHPQFYTPHSHDQNEKTLFNKNIVKYHAYHFYNLNEYHEQFPPEIKEKLIQECPKNLKDYEKIVNNQNSKEKFKSKYQQIIYDYRKIPENERDYDFEPDAIYYKDGTVVGLRFQNWINEDIENYLEHKKINDINLDDFRQRILDSQKNKIFLLCKNGTFNHEKIDDKICIVKEGFKTEGMYLIFKTTNPEYELKMRLRWKNTHGCGKPAYQISLKKI